MSRTKRNGVAIAIVAALGSAASAETLVSRAATSASEGNFPRALAYADAALAHPHVDGAELRRVGAMRDSFGGRWALQAIDKLGMITDANAEAAFGQLGAIRDALSRDHIASTPLDVAIAKATELLATRVGTLEKAGDLAQAEALLSALVAATKTRSDELAALRARAFERRLSQAPESTARAAHPGSTALHLGAAARYGEAPAAELAAARAALEPITHIVVAGRASGTCMGQEAEAERAASTTTGVPVTVEIQFGQCTSSGPEVTRGSASLSYTRTVTQVIPREHIENKGYECHTEATSAGAVTYTSSYERPGCAMPLFVVVQDEAEKRQVDVTESETVGTTTTHFAAQTAAHVVVTWAGGTLQRDVTGVGDASSKEYDAPVHAMRPTSTGTATVRAAGSDALAKLSTKAYSVADEVRGELANAAVARAAATTDPSRVEDELVSAALLVGTAPAELVALVNARYGMSAEELGAALFGTPYALASLGGAFAMPQASEDEILEDERTYHAMFLATATGRSAYAVGFDVGYARTSAPGKDSRDAFVFAFDYFATFPDDSTFSGSVLFDIRYGRGGLLDGRLGFGGGVNVHGVLAHPFVGIGFDRMGLSGENTLHYATAAVAEAGVRLGFAIPHLFAADATFARRRRLDVGTDPVVENRVDLELRVQPVMLDLQYTQVSSSKSDLTSGLTLDHAQGDVLELLVGYGF
ncbi:hypothetical protein BH11MYX2_BH11MYX2_36480 [soil metagenome]